MQGNRQDRKKHKRIVRVYADLAQRLYMQSARMGERSMKKPEYIIRSEGKKACNDMD